MTHFFKSKHKTHYLIILLLIAINISKISAQNNSVELNFNWNGNHLIEKLNSGFDGAIMEKSGEMLVPFYQTKIEGVVSITAFKILETDTFNNVVHSNDWINLNEPKIETFLSKENGKTFTIIKYIPIFKNWLNDVFIIKRMRLEYAIALNNAASKLRKTNKTSSVLAAGDWFKIGVKSTSVYKLDKSLVQSFGVDLSTIELNKVKIYGNGGVILPEAIDEARTDDLAENAIWVNDANNNNKWDNEDYILFYAQGPLDWSFSDSKNEYELKNHLYADEAYYYVTFGAALGKRILNIDNGNSNSPLIEITNYDFLIHREFDEKNVLRSGRDWYLEMFNNSNVQIFKEIIKDVDLTQPVKIRTRLGVRSLTPSRLTIGVNGNDLINKNFYQVSGEYDKDFMTSPEILEGSFIVTSSDINLQFTYSKPAQSSYVYLDYYELLGIAKLKWNNELTSFSKKGSNLNGYIKYKIDGLPDLIWNISDINNPSNQKFENEAGSASFTSNANGQLQRFLMFNPTVVNLKPTFIKKIENQNLHALQNVEYVIITHTEFKEQAKRLAEHHKSLNGLTYVITTPEEIYNEFSSGAPDLTALRDFSKMLYDRNASAAKTYKSLLLLGDASYDYKNKIKNNTNFVPTYQSYNSINPPYSYCSDDYLAILDAGEGYWGLGAKEGLDIGVGRIPCSTKYEAEIMVDKIISYTSKPSFGDWRNQVTFLGDDGDNNNHFEDVEQVTNYILTQAPEYNVNKIYLDAFKQEVFGSGEKYPDVNVAVDQSFDKGNLIFDYLGHGGQSGMAHERVVTRPQISAWTNKDKLPLIVTATCELSRYDDPAQASPGELMLFNEHGGGIALITTSRLVYLGLNKDLNVAVFDKNIFEITDNNWPTLGEVYKNSKNNSARAENQRNFILLGDPALVLNYPRGGIITTKINQVATGNSQDTLKALEAVSIEGEVLTPSGAFDSTFNGTLYPTVYDKFLTYKTLGNDQESQPAEYKLQNSVLHRGKVSAINGKFSFSFVVPKDIAYQYGFGKISYYADNQERDAGGYFNDFYIGGTSKETAIDTTPPSIQLFMEDETFKFGDMVSNKPLLLAKVFDFNGINTVGNGIGRDITAILDRGTENEKLIILNDFYKSKLDSYQEGEIRFPMELLMEGRHTIHLKLWDVYNNSADAYTEFVVGNAKKPEIKTFISYPNPTEGAATFVFNHNLVGQTIQVSFEVMSLEGKIVYSESLKIENAEARVEIADNGYNKLSGLASGMYISKLTLKDVTNKLVVAYNKIIIR
jgi:hypothetical protein